MIVGNIKDVEKYFSIHPKFKEAFEWIKNVSCKPCDKTLIDGEHVWGRVFEDKHTETKKTYEAHRTYADIHYIIDGTEEFAWSHIDKLSSIKEYDSNCDCELLEGSINKLNLNAGDFCILFPEDAHIPALTVESVTALRAMVKIIL